MCLGPAPGARLGEGRIVRVQFPAFRIEAKHEDPVESQVGHGEKRAARIKYGVVPMRACLAFPIRARFARQGHQIGARPQGSVLLDRHYADRAGAVIGGDDPAAGRVDRQVHRVLAAAGLPIERRDMPGLLIDRIGAELVEVGVYRIEKAARPVERQEGRVNDLEELFAAPGARGRVRPIDVDAAAMPFALRVVKAPR
jgi:hypothetical protein